MKRSIYLYSTILGLLFLTVFLTSCRKYSTSINPHEYLEYKLLEDGTYSVIGFTKTEVKNLIIPSKHKNKDVSTIEKGAFKMKTGIWGGRISLPILTLQIEEGVRIIEEEAFYKCGLVDAKLADSIEIIEESAFYGNNTKINLPKNTKFIGSETFYETKLTGHIDTTGIELSVYAFRKTDITSITFPNTMEIIPRGLCWESDLLANVVLPLNLIEIGEVAFEDCKMLKNINLPESLEIVGRQAFHNSGITEVILKDKIRSVKMWAFSGCENLQKVEFPNHNFELENGAFSGCINLNNVLFGKSKINVRSVFNFCPLENMSVKEDSFYAIVDGCLTIINNDEYELVLGYSDFNNFDRFTKINEYAFGGRDFDKLDIKSNIHTISSYAFIWSEINDANIAAENINSNAFEDSSINKLTISSKNIGYKAFYNVKKLTEVIIGEGCENISSEAFSCCFDLEKVYLPASLKIIETGAFLQCHKLKEVYYELKQGTPVIMYSGNFIKYISNVLNKEGKIDVRLYDGFHIYVYEEIYDECINLWSGMPDHNNYVFKDNLVDYIKVR